MSRPVGRQFQPTRLKDHFHRSRIQGSPRNRYPKVRLIRKIVQQMCKIRHNMLSILHNGMRNALGSYPWYPPCRPSLSSCSPIRILNTRERRIRTGPDIEWSRTRKLITDYYVKCNAVGIIGITSCKAIRCGVGYWRIPKSLYHILYGVRAGRVILHIVYLHVDILVV